MELKKNYNYPGLAFQIVFLSMLDGLRVQASSCTFSNCILIITDDHGSQKTIDLNKYNQFLTYNEVSTGRYYDFQPCGTIASGDPENCIGFKGCQISSATTSHPMGLKDNPVRLKHYCKTLLTDFEMLAMILERYLEVFCSEEHFAEKNIAKINHMFQESCQNWFSP